MNDDTHPDTVRDPETLPEVKQGLEDTSAPVETSFATPAKKRSPKRISAAIITAVIIVLAGVGVFGYTTWYRNPDKVVHDAVLNMLAADSVSSTGTVAYRDQDTTLDIGLDGGFGENGGELSVAAAMTIDTDQMRQDYEVAGVGRFISDTLYLKLNGIEALVEKVTAESDGQIPAYAQNIYQKIDDKWISIKASDYEDIDASVADKQECVTNLLEKMQTESNLSEDVIDLYSKNQILLIDEELGSRSINDTDSLGYKVSVDRDAAKAFAAGLNDTNFGRQLKECNEDVDFKEIAEDFSGESAENGRTVELWVSKTGHDFTEISIRENSEDTNESLDITVQPTFNKAVNVEIPSDTSSFETILEEIQQVILEYYSDAFAPATRTVPEGFSSSLDDKPIPTV